MTKIMYLPIPQGDRVLPPMKPANQQNVLAIGTPLGAPLTLSSRAELELLDRIRIWINEGGGGGDIQ